ncbi:tetratricopeptide repeat protein [Corallincola spongiicola]|uniref:Tetratricopeptide repeat protein n=1 Tax=Corallincola spongiicola TaxID=2520508 RepID=A0ABY1WNB9_9GAMM|nr:tetratricopeptide repeat protein [Corallincola spongiicola]TAA44972.1 tetratricopeptide repeat protein [Corallincola spongiicola]
MMKRSLLALLMPLTLAACSSNDPQVVKTLADLEPIERQPFQRPQVDVSTQGLIHQYQSLLEVSEDPNVRIYARYRLVDLGMLHQEEVLAEDASFNTDSLDGLIADYQALLATYPDQPDNHAVLYQLAKAYDLKGDLPAAFATLTTLIDRYPDSPHVAEAQFRRGDILFSQRKYREADQAFTAVIKQPEASSYLLNAHYMRGWCRFKQTRYDAAQRDYLFVLDNLLEEHTTLEGLPKTRRTLANDTLRVMSLTFSYQAGGESVRTLLATTGKRSWDHLLYQHLAEYQLGKELYQQSADTYLAYIKDNTETLWAAQFDIRVLAIYKEAGFTTLIRPEKERFVKLWGQRSGFWQRSEVAVRDQLAPHLHAFLLELGQYYHATVQHQKQAVGKGAGSDVKQQVAQGYQLAADWHLQFLDTFPLDPKTPDIRFLMAEALYEAGSYSDAIAAYELVAYAADAEPLSNIQRSEASYEELLAYKLTGYDAQAPVAAPAMRAEAGYAALVAYQKLMQQAEVKALPKADNQALQLKRIRSQLRFADRFSQDKRAKQAQTLAAQSLLKLQRYDEATEVAMRLLAWQPTPDNAQQRIAHLVIGHSAFANENFAVAEQAYQQSLALMKKSDPQRDDTRKKLAAAIYRQGEQAVADGDKALAVKHYLRLGETVPESGFRKNAEYDAATLLLELERWEEAVAILNQFAKRYPKSPLVADIPAKLAFAYEQSGNWQQAAKQYLVLADRGGESAADKEASRQSLLAAAEMYEKADDLDGAINSYRRYAHAYPEPFAMAMEVRAKMAGFYQRTGDEIKRNYWLKKLVKLDAEGGDERSDRSRYLAAFAAQDLAVQQQRTFDSIRLKLPLRKSLKKKRAALDKSLAAWQQVANYQQAEFTTEATYRIAEIYGALSRDLMDSDRPNGLDEMELEQYELLLEEQAYPFEEQAIEVHQANTENAWQGNYDDWVKRSFEALAELLPAQFDKPEQEVSFSDYAH